MPKLTPIPFSRGTKLSIDQLSDNLVPIRDSIQTPTLDEDNLKHPDGSFSVAIPIPVIGARLVEFPQGRLAVPVPLLPLQDEWNADLVANQDTPRPRLRSISISINQRAEGYGIVDYYSGGEEGRLTATDMTRYDTTLELISKPLAMTTTGIDRYARNLRTVWKTTLPGADLLNQADATPVSFTNLNETMDPYAGHWIIVTCPGLFTTDPAQINCCLPSLFIVLTFDRVLVKRDTQVNLFAIDLQNAPIPNTPNPTPIALTLPSSNQVIVEGHTQGNLEAIDRPVAETLDAGWQPYGELKPTEQILIDSSYSVIAIPMWPGYEDIRQNNITALPYTTGPGYLDPTADRRLCVLPDGFVLHHCLLWRSTAGFPCPLTGGYASPMSSVVAASFRVRVGLGLVEGWDTENTRYQQAAYLELTGISLSENTVDLLGQIVAAVPYIDGVLHYVPLVHPNTDPSTNGFFQTGKPIYSGRGNRKTNFPRTPIAPLPNGGPYVPSVAEGQETHVEARWTIQDAVLGLNGGPPDSYVLGNCGGMLYLVGKMPLARQDAETY